MYYIHLCTIIYIYIDRWFLLAVASHGELLHKSHAVKTRYAWSKAANNIALPWSMCTDIYIYIDILIWWCTWMFQKYYSFCRTQTHTHGIPCLRSRLKQGHASIGSWAIKPSRYRSNGNWAEAMLTSTAKALTWHWQNNSPWSQIHEVHSHMVHYGPIIYYTVCI